MAAPAKAKLPALVTDLMLMLHAAAHDNALAWTDTPLLLLMTFIHDDDSGAMSDDSRASFALENAKI